MKNKIIVVLSVFAIIVVMLVVLFFLKNDNLSSNYTEDEIKFKEEYESLNGIEVIDNYVLKNVNVDIDNNVKYVSNNEIMDLLTKGSNVIYFGWSDCNWCRSIVSPLINVLKENEIDTLYYYDLKDLRNSYLENKDEEKVKLYEYIIKIVGKDINTTFDDDSIRHNEKKMLAPTVVFIKNGVYLGLHVKSVDSQINSTDELSDKQINELKDIYRNYILEMKANVCVDEGC